MTGPLSIHAAVSETVRNAMRKDERLTLIIADRQATLKPDGIAGLKPDERALHKEFGPWRVMRLGYAPETLLGAAFGAAAGGLHVVADLTHLDDVTGLFDELVRYEAGLRAQSDTAPPALVLRARLGADTPSAYLLGGFAAQSNLLSVALPATPSEAQGLMLEALRLGRPALLLEQDAPSGRDETAGFASAPVPFGCGKELRRGDDLTVIAFAPQAPEALRAAEILAASDGISCHVIDPRTMAPLDMRLMRESVERTGRLVVLEPEGLRCPIASEIVSRMAETAFSALIGPVARVPVAKKADPTLLADALRAAYARRT